MRGIYFGTAIYSQFWLERSILKKIYVYVLFISVLINTTPDLILFEDILVCFCFFLFKGQLNFVGYLMPKPSL